MMRKAARTSKATKATFRKSIGLRSALPVSKHKRYFRVFQAPLHDLAGLWDLSMVIEIIGEERTEGQSRRLRRTASRRARELILRHATRVARLAARLTERGRVTPDEFLELMKGT